MIIDEKPMSMAEAKKIVDSTEKEEVEETSAYLKKFTKLKVEEAEEMRKELEALEIIQLRPEQLVKIIDTLPQTVTDVNKISPELSLNEDETKKILEITKKYK